MMRSMRGVQKAIALSIMVMFLAALTSAAPAPRRPRPRPVTRPTSLPTEPVPSTQPDVESTTQPAAPDAQAKPAPDLQQPKSWGELERNQQSLGRWARGSITSIKGDTIQFRVPGQRGKPPTVHNLTVDDQTVIHAYTRAKKPSGDRVVGPVTWVRIDQGTRQQLRPGTNAAISWDEFGRTLVIQTGVYVSGDLGIVGSMPSFSMPNRPPPATAPTTQPAR